VASVRSPEREAGDRAQVTDLREHTGQPPEATDASASSGGGPDEWRGPLASPLR
jgi:hypothetical protein